MRREGVTLRDGGKCTVDISETTPMYSRYPVPDPPVRDLWKEVSDVTTPYLDT